MGDLVVMSRTQPPPPRALLDGHSAEILFFTGVRYFRMEEPAEPKSVQRLDPRRRADQRKVPRRSADERRRERLAKAKFNRV